MRVIEGDCLSVMPTLDAESVDSIVCDPPYGLKFMGKQWDHGIPGVPFWEAALRVAKPGAYLLAFGGTRTHHRLACAIEDAGWEIRDVLFFLYGSGFPKSMNIGCKCGEPPTERDVRPVRGTDIPQAINATDKQSKTLFSRLSESDVSETGTTRPESEDADGKQSGLEGRDHVQAEQGELHRAEVRAVPSGVCGDGEGRRLRNGTPISDGADVGPVPDSGGGRASSRPQHTEQRARKSTILPEQRGAQEGGRRCEACGGLVEWKGWGTALKPAVEPIILARKPFKGTVAANVQEHGTGALNIDGCRIGNTVETWPQSRAVPAANNHMGYGKQAATRTAKTGAAPSGRWPANLILDEESAAMLDEQSGEKMHSAGTARDAIRDAGKAGMFGLSGGDGHRIGDSGGASRFFFVSRGQQCDCAKTVVSSSSPSNEPDASAPNDAATSDSREDSPLDQSSLGLESTVNSPDCTQPLRHVSSVADPDSIDTTPTTLTYCGSCGCVLPATDESINPASAEKVEGVNVQVSGTRFWYTAKASRSEREAGLDGFTTDYNRGSGTHGNGTANTRLGNQKERAAGVTHVELKRVGNNHPTVKPLDLMQWLCRLVTPKGGLILDPFCGSGTTGRAAVAEGFQFIGIEMNPEYAAIARARIAEYAPLFGDVA